jgi:hypothetical protein
MASRTRFHFALHRVLYPEVNALNASTCGSTCAQIVYTGSSRSPLRPR